MGVWRGGQELGLKWVVAGFAFERQMWDLFGMRELLLVSVCCFQCSSSIVFALGVRHVLHWQFVFCDESLRCVYFRLLFFRF